MSMDRKNRILVVIVGIISFFVMGFLIGAYFGGFLAYWTLQEIASVAIPVTIGESLGVIQLMRDLFKDRNEARRVPKLDWECLVENGEKHHCSAISQSINQKGKVISIKIMNSGLDAADNCSGRADFDEVFQKTFKTLLKDQTLNWSHFNIGSEVEHNIIASPYQYLGERIQETYATKFDQDLLCKKDERLEICFTLKDYDVAYVLACGRRSKLPMGKTYHIKLQLTGRGLAEKPRTFKLDLRSWTDVSFKEEL